MNWNDITVKQWYELEKVKDYEDDFDKRLVMIAAVTNSTFDEVTELKMSEIHKLSLEYAFLNTPMKTKVVRQWKDYNFTLKLSDLSAGQMIDYLEATKQGETNYLHTVLAILDNGKKDFELKQKEILNDCPITIVKGINDFFFRKYYLSPQAIQNYSLLKLKKMTKELKNLNQESQADSMKIGGGLFGWRNWPIFTTAK